MVDKKRKKSLEDSDVLSFLLNAYFGKIGNPVYSAVDSAYLDLNRTIEFKKAESVSDEKKANLRQEAVKTIMTKIESLKRSGNITQASFDIWHKSLCESILGVYSKEGIQFHYGQAQKWVNMSLKYLSVIRKESIAGFFEFMHVPIDSIIIDEANEEFGLQRPDVRWSRMDEHEYSDYQKRLRSAIITNTDLCPMLWEFRSWER